MRDSIGKLVAEFKQISLDVVFDVDCRTEDDSFGEVVDLTAYRFVQESILNAIRHGQAGRIGIRLDRHAARRGDPGASPSLSVEVEDDGAGPPRKPSKGLWLLGIAERVEALGGAWNPPARIDARTHTMMSVPFQSARRIDPDRSARS